ncbi:MAG: hypothetical protein LBI35_05225 [Burkholderiales bacterium]|nr:hypothetical protein [Burkholderiales bacterium]
MGKPRGMPTQGARLYFKVAEESTAWLKAESVNQLDWQSGSAAKIDITDFDSKVKENLSGMADMGSLSVAGNYLDEDRGPNILTLEDKYIEGSDPFPVRVCMPQDATKTIYIVKEFMATIEKFDTSAKVDDKQGYTATLNIVSKPVRYDSVPVSNLGADDLD